MARPVRRMAVNLAAWLGGAVVSVGVGVAAVAQIDQNLTAEARQPLRPDAVTSDVSDPLGRTTAETAPSPTSRPKPTGKPPTAGATSATGHNPPPPRTVEREITSPGGSIIAVCTDGQVYLTSWSPHPGYHAERVERGPATISRLTFQTGDRHVNVEVRCLGDAPQATIGRRDGGEDHPGAR